MENENVHTSSPLWKCGESNGNVEHLLLFCPLPDICRKEMISEIMDPYRSADSGVKNKTIDIQTLSGENEHLPKIVRKNIKIAAANRSNKGTITGRFIRSCVKL